MVGEQCHIGDAVVAVLEPLKWACQSGDCNKHRAAAAIWSGLVEADAWRDNEVLKALHQLSDPCE